MNKIVAYFKASAAEMKKVSWPTKKETKNYTLLVVGVSLAVSIFLGALDIAFTWGLNALVTK